MLICRGAVPDADEHARGAAKPQGGLHRCLWWLFGILVAGWTIRIVLALHGGQMFWLDEWFRWTPGLRVATALLRNQDPSEAFLIVVRQPWPHVGFVVFTAPAALLFKTLGSTPVAMSVATGLLALASVAVVGIVYPLALRVGADAEEALLAAALTAATACLTVYARHVLPYDVSMALALGTLWLALGERTSWRRSISVGIGSGAALLVYYGYQSLVAAVLVAHVFAGPGRRIRVAGSIVGFAIPLLVFHVMGMAVGAPPFVAGFWRHQTGNGPRTMADVQGDLGEGWLLPFRYFWASEHGLAVVWLAALVAAPFFVQRTPRVRWWLAMVALLYGQLALFSTGLGVAAALGRLARPLAPFLCLLTAAVFRDWLRRPAALVLGTVALVGQAAWNLATPMQQVWPSRLHQEIKPLRAMMSVRGPEEAGKTVCAAQSSTVSNVVLVNTCTWMYPLRDTFPLRGRTLARWPHPLEYLPYQYEVLNPEMRAVAARSDLGMRLIDQSR